MQRDNTDLFVRSADDLEKLKNLLGSGSVTPYEFIHLKPKEGLTPYDGERCQFDLLNEAFEEYVDEWLVEWEEDDYQGAWIVVFRLKDGRYCIEDGYFGSCPVCDPLAEENPYEWLEDNVKDIRAFPTLESLKTWLETTDTYAYDCEFWDEDPPNKKGIRSKRKARDIILWELAEYTDKDQSTAP